MTEPAHHARDSDFDAIVIGAGVVGCAVARKLVLEGASVLVVEKAADILEGASKGNSALLHTGFDAPPDSVELAAIRDGHREFLALRERLSLPMLESGALVVAWNDDEGRRLESILARARVNGIADVRLVEPAEVKAMEPELADGAAGAVYVPGEAIIDPWSTPYAYLLQAVVNGARVVRDCEVTGGEYTADGWRLRTTRGTFTGACVINCAGLYGDIVNRRLIGEALFTIRPRKGQFVVYDKSAGRLAGSIILPVPTEITKGVVVTRTIFGNLLVGPTAEEQDSRGDASVDTATLEALMRRGAAIVPALTGHPVTATYAGIRPATQSKDYRIDARDDPPYVSVGGIRSTGLSAALGIANLVHRHYRDLGPHREPLDEPVWPRVPTISEYGERDWQLSGNGGIVCHCELVTRREIEHALDEPLAAAALGDLKRRTRVTMGRCQGFYCSARLAEVTAGRLEIPLAADIDR